MTYRINYSMLANIKHGGQRLEALDAEIKKCEYLCLTDALSHPDLGGPLVLQFLDDEARRMAPARQMRLFRIHVLRDEWGNEPPAFMTVSRDIELPPKTRDDRLISNRALNDMRRRGTYNGKYVITRKYELDDRGCFECGYEDAGYFLSEFGVSFESNPKMALAANGRRELSGGPCKAPDGTLKHVWYWRYEEAPPWYYVNLPVITKPKDKPQRGKPRASVD
jgi:hypothetical protein